MENLSGGPSTRWRLGHIHALFHPQAHPRQRDIVCVLPVKRQFAKSCRPLVALFVLSAGLKSGGWGTEALSFLSTGPPPAIFLTFPLPASAWPSPQHPIPAAR